MPDVHIYVCLALVRCLSLNIFILLTFTQSIGIIFSINLSSSMKISISHLYTEPCIQYTLFFYFPYVKKKHILFGLLQIRVTLASQITVVQNNILGKKIPTKG